MKNVEIAIPIVLDVIKTLQHITILILMDVYVLLITVKKVCVMVQDVLNV